MIFAQILSLAIYYYITHHMRPPHTPINMVQSIKEGKGKVFPSIGLGGP
jgi:hypothetical protein